MDESDDAVRINSRAVNPGDQTRVPTGRFAVTR